MADSKIEWCDKVWNPVTGCDQISPGCRNCYAKGMARRLKAMGVEKYRNEFKVTCHTEALGEPLKWKNKPRRIFVCSMGDLFHDDVPFRFIAEVFKTIGMCSAAKDGRKDHIFMVLTKRPERMMLFFKKWPLFENLSNVWLGVSVENKRQKERVDVLRDIPAAVRFLSVEPLLEDLGDVDLSGIGWVTVGAESGPKRRFCSTSWVRLVSFQCKMQKVPYFIKQISVDGKISKKTSEWPEDLRIQEMPG